MFLRIQAACLLLAGQLPAAILAQNPDSSLTRKADESIVVLGDSSRAVSEDSVIALALGHSRRLQSLSANVDIAERELASSGSLPNPELRMGHRFMRNNYVDLEESRIGLRIRFPELGETAEEKERARTDLWERKVEKIRYQQDLTARVRRDFADVIAADRMVEMAKRKVDLLDRRIGMIEHLIQTGDRSVVYYMKAKTMRAQARNDYSRAVQKQGSARRQLAVRTDLAIDTPLADSPMPEPPNDLDQAVRIANLNRPETELVRQQMELAVKQRNLERLRLLPWINYLQFSYNEDRTRARYWGEVSAGIDIPLFNWNIGNIRATNLAVRKREARVEGVLEMIEEEVQSAYSLYRDLWLDWMNFKVSSEMDIRESQNVISRSSVYGTLRSDEVLELEMTIIETQQLQVEKKYDLACALSELLYAMGVEKLQTPQ